MSTQTPAVTSDSGSVVPSTHSGARRWLASETRIWRAVLYGLGGGALAGAVLASILAGYEQRLLPMPWHLLLFGFLGFAFVSAGDGILTLLSKLMRTVFRGLRWERPEHLLQAIPQTPIGQLLAVMLFLYGRRLFPESIFSSVGLPPSTQLGRCTLWSCRRRRCASGR